VCFILTSHWRATVILNVHVNMKTEEATKEARLSSKS
jgi:hypothetical protein